MRFVIDSVSITAFFVSRAEANDQRECIYATARIRRAAKKCIFTGTDRRANSFSSASLDANHIFCLFQYKSFIAGAAAICLIIMAVSWYQGAIFGVDTGLLVCEMLPDGVPKSWYQWHVVSGAAIAIVRNILLTDRKGLFIIKLKKSEVKFEKR